MNIGHSIAIRREHYMPPKQYTKRGGTPESDLSRAARESGLTYDQMYWRVRVKGMSIDEAIAWQPPAQSEIARLGGLARVAKARRST